MGIITDMAFDAVDADGSCSLDGEELLDITQAVAVEMKINPPGENDIFEVLEQLDADNDGEVSKTEFLQLMGLVITSMLESELYLQNQLEEAEEEKILKEDGPKNLNRKSNISINLLDRLKINV